MLHAVPDGVQSRIGGNERALIVTVLLLVGVLFAYRASIDEIQASDEALYVVRADACLDHGAWLDQSDYAIGGLYSATHPPLGIWTIALSRAIFGRSEFATRIPVILASLVAALGLYVLVRKTSSPTIAASIAATIMFSAQVSWYGTHAQLDVPLLACSVWAVVVAWRFSESGESRFGVLTALLVGAALLTKFAWGAAVLPFIFYLAVRSRRPALLAWMTAGIAFAASWYIFMYLNHPTFLHHVLGVATDASYESDSGRGQLYYVNQLLIQVPYIVLVPFALARWKDVIHLGPSLAWLILVLAALTIMETRMPHFVLVMLAPAAIVAGEAIAALRTTDRRLIAVIVPALALATIWAVLPDVRATLRGMARATPLVSYIIAFGAALIGVYWTHRRALSGMVMTVAVAFMLQAWVIGVTYSEQYRDSGAREISVLLDRVQPSKIAVLHGAFPFDELVPQLVYYTHGRNRALIMSAPHAPYIRPDSALVQKPDLVVVVRSKRERMTTENHRLRAQYMRLLTLDYPISREYNEYDVFYR